ncbi:RDD family protein [Dokdonella sp.]|uniref:RDD family protein n=1 Tax=Dokdonella sp. TaxID=2291710 RepID=UPI003782ECD6
MPSATPASLWLRAAAVVYDLFPLIGLWMLTAALAMLIAHGDVDAAHPPATWRALLQMALFAVTATYFVASWSRGGQTIGMRAWRTRVVSTEGRALPWPRALLRFSLALVSLLAFGLGFAWCLFDRRGRAWHDIIARSELVRIER